MLGRDQEQTDRNTYRLWIKSLISKQVLGELRNDNIRLKDSDITVTDKKMKLGGMVHVGGIKTRLKLYNMPNLDWMIILGKD